MSKSLESKDISNLSVDDFLELIVRTKQPQIFAESSVYVGYLTGLTPSRMVSSKRIALLFQLSLSTWNF